MKHRSTAGLAGLVLALLLAAPAVAAGPATVTVRVEGPSGTIVPRTTVTTTTAPVNNDGQAGHECTGTSAAGALQLATAGDWSGEWFDGLGYQVHGIRGVFDDESSNYWNFWLDYGASDVGVCDAELEARDDVLLFIDCFTSCRSPLRLSRVPATAAPGSTAGVLVETFQVVGVPQVTTAVPAAGATVDVGGRQFTTGSDGIAQVTFEQVGPVAIRATKAAHVPSATEQTCVSNGSDGACGSVQPSVPDTTAPTASILGIRNGQRFNRRRAPRELRGTVSSDPSGLWAVKIRLTRRYKGTCWYFSGSREQFLKRTCGKRYAFKVGEEPEWSYLLPRRLPRGRYVLDTYAIDNAFNRGEERRVVFRVR
jgi:hypothetical protein